MKTSVLVDVKIVCDAPRTWSPTLEGREKELLRWVREFDAFMRDHRSQDPVSLSVEREYQEQCSHCHYEWCVDEDGQPACCAKAQAEWNAAQIKEPS